MKKAISLLLILLLMVSVSAHSEQIITVDAFAQRYNDCMTAFYKAFRQKYTPVEAAITETHFTLELPNSKLEGITEAGRVVSVDILAEDATGSLIIMGAVAALSSLDGAADIMDPGKQAKHILMTGDPDITTTNGYSIEIIERFKSGEAKHAIIKKLP